jgi:HSP90 family molecular chaperone
LKYFRPLLHAGREIFLRELLSNAPGALAKQHLKRFRILPPARRAQAKFIFACRAGQSVSI